MHIGLWSLDLFFGKNNRQADISTYQCDDAIRIQKVVRIPLLLQIGLSHAVYSPSSVYYPLINQTGP